MRIGFRTHVPQTWILVVLVVVLPLGRLQASATGPHPGTVARPGAPSDSTSRPLPFLPAVEPGAKFSASELTKAYSRDLTSFLRPTIGREAIALETLDRYAEPVYPPPPERDSSDVRVVGEGDGTAATVPPGERESLSPPAAGVRVGIPSPVAAGATIVGGLALLVSVIASFFH